MQGAKPAVTDPKTGQVIQPAVTELDGYTKIYPVLKKEWPRAPDPKSFNGDNNLFIDSLAHPVLDQARGPLAAEKAKQDELNKNKLYQSQQLIDQKTKELSDAIATKGANSKEAKDLANALQLDVTDAQRQARGGEAGTVDTFTNKIFGKGFSVPTPNELIQQNGPQAPSGSPSTSPSIPQGRVLVKSPDGKMGHIPADQLQDAMKSGYSQVQ